MCIIALCMLCVYFSCVDSFFAMLALTIALEQITIFIGLLNHLNKFLFPDSYRPDPGLCTLRSGEYECVVNNSDSVTIPCGSFKPKKGISFTYYLLENRSILKEQLENYLQWNVSWRESGSHICCRPNVSVTLFEDPCYRLNITCEYNNCQWPVFATSHIMKGDTVKYRIRKKNIGITSDQK